jgi:hypothetical protein
LRHNGVVETLEQIKARLEAAIPDVILQIIPNDSPSAQRSLLVAPGQVLAVAEFYGTARN